MISKLPRWVWTGAWALAFVAGMVNAVGLLGVERQAVTHLTGTTSLLAAALAKFDGVAIFRFAALLGSFLAGCALSGFLIRDGTLRLGRRYGVALLIESALLAAAVPLLRYHAIVGLCVASLACGLQNAMASTYSGTVVRTTHLSGMFTDLGVFLGHSLGGVPVDPRRRRMCLIVISGFLSGGIAGAVGFRHFGEASLLIPAGLTAVASVAYGLYGTRSRPNP
ncbi:YoaK family protein [Zavarzinella formosa]|uniref:YoaK family protein n=1 Tax=Zavarzinella formosa TaxID=360055 RepID=UPI0002E4C022|nr:YoaK family protein [Zavarzinella formosa]